MTSQTKPSRFSKKLLAAIVVMIIVVASAAAVAEYTLTQSSSSPTNLPAMTLTVIGADGTQKVLTEKDIAALPSYTAKGGFKSSGGIIADIGTYTGVPITEVLNLVGGMTADETLTVTASDGYSMVYTYNQIVNAQDYTTYDPVTGSEKSATQPMKTVLTYFINGSALASGDGPLRLGILGPEGLLTEGHFWSKMVTTLQVTSNVKDWSVTVEATSNLNMTRQAFTADLNHYGINYTDSSGNVWKGSALWRWVSWSNYNGGVSNASLDAGYSVKIVSGDGTSATFTDSQVKNNDNIIVAAELNGAVLSDPYWPLTLVGSAVSSQNSIKNIVEIDIILSSPQATTTATATPTPLSTPAPQTWSIPITGTSTVTLAASDFAIQAGDATAMYTDSSGTFWVGTSLYQIVMWAENNGAISSSLLTSGYVVKVISSSGSFKTFNDTRISGDMNIMLANSANYASLSGSNAPLVLAGSDLSSGEKLIGVTQIQIIPLQDLSLTIVGPSGTVTLFSNDLIALTSYTANGGTHSSGGTLANNGSYTGVPIMTLLNLVGGVTSSNAVTFTGSDSFSSSFSYAQLTGQGITMWNSAGVQTTPTQSVTLIVAYFLNGANIPSGTGPLRVMLVGPDGLYMTGSYSAKLTVKITIT